MLLNDIMQKEQTLFRNSSQSCDVFREKKSDFLVFYLQSFLSYTIYTKIDVADVVKI